MIKTAALDEGTTINRFSPYQNGTMGVDILVLAEKKGFRVLGQDGPLVGM